MPLPPRVQDAHTRQRQRHPVPEGPVVLCCSATNTGRRPAARRLGVRKVSDCAVYRPMDRFSGRRADTWRGRGDEDVSAHAAQRACKHLACAHMCSLDIDAFAVCIDRSPLQLILPYCIISMRLRQADESVFGRETDWWDGVQHGAPPRQIGPCMTTSAWACGRCTRRSPGLFARCRGVRCIFFAAEWCPTSLSSRDGA